MSTARFDKYDELEERRATKRDAAAMKRQAKARESGDRAAYEAGIEEGKQAAKSSRKPASPATSSKRSRRSSANPVTKGARQAVREVQAPVQASVYSGMRILILTLAVVSLYVFLTSVETVSKGITSLQGGLAWLMNPDSSIPYKS